MQGVISSCYLILIDMDCAMCLSNEKAIEEAMKKMGTEELKGKLKEAI